MHCILSVALQKVQYNICFFTLTKQYFLHSDYTILEAILKAALAKNFIRKLLRLIHVHVVEKKRL